MRGLPNHLSFQSERSRGLGLTGIVSVNFRKPMVQCRDQVQTMGGSQKDCFGKCYVSFNRVFDDVAFQRQSRPIAR